MSINEHAKVWKECYSLLRQLQTWDFGEKFIEHSSRQIWQLGRAGQAVIVALSSQSI